MAGIGDLFGVLLDWIGELVPGPAPISSKPEGLRTDGNTDRGPPPAESGGKRDTGELRPRQ